MKLEFRNELIFESLKSSAKQRRYERIHQSGKGHKQKYREKNVYNTCLGIMRR